MPRPRCEMGNSKKRFKSTSDSCDKENTPTKNSKLVQLPLATSPKKKVVPLGEKMNNHCSKRDYKQLELNFKKIIRVEEEDHHHPPPARQFEFHEDLDEVQPPWDPKSNIVFLPAPDLSSIESQIDYWHERETRSVINSLKVDIREKPYFSILIYKRWGSTVGQCVHLDMFEVEQLISLLVKRIIPDVYSAIKNSFTTVIKKPVPYGPIEVEFEPIDFAQLGVPRDGSHSNEDKPAPAFVLEKIQQQMKKKSFYEQGLYKFRTVSVHLNLISKRWLIGLYKTTGEKKYQCVWLSIYEAQWLADTLMKLYEQSIPFLQMQMDTKNSTNG